MITQAFALHRLVGTPIRQEVYEHGIVRLRVG